MKKIILFLLLLCINIKPISANEKVTILIQIENHKDMYIADISNHHVDMKILFANTYMPHTLLNNKAATLSSLFYRDNMQDLINTIESNFSINIDYYIYMDIATLLKDLNITNQNYDSLKDLCKQVLNIKKQITLPILFQFKKYLHTDLDLKALTSLYMDLKDQVHVEYYTLNYFVYEDKYIPMSTSFYVKQK